MACSSVELKGIGLGCKDHTGGIKEVYLAKESDFGAVALDDLKSMISSISMVSEAKLKTYRFRKGTSYMNSNATSDEANGTFSVQTDLFLQFSKMETAKRMEIMGMCIDAVKGVVLDNNGHYWFIGYDQPVTASAATGATGTAFGDFGGYQITLSDNSKEFPFELSASAVSALKSLIQAAPEAN